MQLSLELVWCSSLIPSIIMTSQDQAADKRAQAEEDCLQVCVSS